MIRATRLQRKLRNSDFALLILAALSGLGGGVAMNSIGWLAHGLQHLLYGVTINRLSALGSIHHPWRLLALPLGGAVLGLLGLFLTRSTRTPVDVIEANAMHGGRIPVADNLQIALQTIISNGAGASVGLEAAYAQAGGGIASMLGQWARLRRQDLRVLVGAGAGAAVGAAFGAPICGAFYAFEVVIGAYAPASIAPVMLCSLVAVSVSRVLGTPPYLIATTATRTLSAMDYAVYALLGLVCALIGIGIMYLVSLADTGVRASRVPNAMRPFLGGLLLIPIAWVSPQALSAGHGALHLDLVLQPTIVFLATVLVLKVLAAVVSLSLGFRGGLFFASLFLGSLVGQIFGGLATLAGWPLDPVDVALVGMASLSVTIVGGPFTLTMLVLETTHDFALTGVVLTAALVSSAFTRATFGYSFSTWRMHMRGSEIRSPRDIGWELALTAMRLMRTDFRTVPADATLHEVRQLVPLGLSTKAIALDADGRYEGIVDVATAHSAERDETTPVGTILLARELTVDAVTPAPRILQLMDEGGVEELAVVDPDRRVLGVVGERYVRRRLAEQVDAQQRALFGEN